MRKIRPTILIADDDANDRVLLESAFRGLSLFAAIHLVSSGNEAIAYLMGEGKYSSRAEFPYPSFILTDLKMPDGDGVALLQHLKANPAWAVIPIVVLSSSNDPDDIRAAYALGASSYHVKPNNFEELCSQLDVLGKYWMNCEIPEVDASGKQVPTSSDGRIGPRLPQANQSAQTRVTLRSQENAAVGEIQTPEGPVELLNREDARYWIQAIVESSMDAIISKDLDGIIISCNPSASRLFGYEAAELIGHHMTILVPPNLWNEEAEILGQVRRGVSIEHFETTRRRKDGSLVEVSLTISPVKNHQGKVIGASKIAHDITGRKLSEKNLAESFAREKAARELAEKANLAKDGFLAALSHELRTPLNPILLIASDSADDPELPPEVRNNFETIRKNTELQGRLIDDLLDLTRISRDKLQLHSRPAHPLTILKEAIANIQSESNEKNIEIVIDWPPASAMLNCDEVRIQQVFWNVLRNGVKFSPPGSKIVITATVLNERLILSIADSGIGMSEGEIGGIFEAFSQGDTVRGEVHRYGGLGLGLAISRQLVEMHSGRIYARSAGREKGSTFVIELPLMAMDSPEAPALEKSAPPGAALHPAKHKSILLVEDHEPTRTALSHLLTRRQFKVLPAASIAEARALLAREKVDFVISDIGLPDGNGNALMLELRQHYGLNGLALTGYGMEKDVENSLASGFLKHLVKPVNIRSLENALEAFLT